MNIAELNMAVGGRTSLKTTTFFGTLPFTIAACRRIEVDTMCFCFFKRYPHEINLIISFPEWTKRMSLSYTLVSK